MGEHVKREDDDRAEYITGTIKLPDGSESQFSISTGNWQQWGGVTKERLGRSVPIVEAMVAGLTEENLLTSEHDGDYEEDAEGDDAEDGTNSDTEACDECGAAVPTEGQMANNAHDESCSLHDGQRATRVALSIEDPGRWVAQSFYPEIGRWFDMGDSRATEAEARAYLDSQGVTDDEDPATGDVLIRRDQIPVVNQALQATDLPYPGMEATYPSGLFVMRGLSGPTLDAAVGAGALLVTADEKFVVRRAAGQSDADRVIPIGATVRDHHGFDAILLKAWISDKNEQFITVHGGLSKRTVFASAFGLVVEAGKTHG